MKILLVANGYPPNSMGGVEVYSANLARTLTAQKHTVEVLCRVSDPAQADNTLLSDGDGNIAIHRIVNDSKKLASFEETYTNERIDRIVNGLLEQVQPDIIHFNHLLGLSVRLPAIARERGIPCIFSLHDYWPFCYRVNLVNRQRNVCPGLRQGGDCQSCVLDPSTGVGNQLQGWFKKILPYTARRLIRQSVLQEGSQRLIGFERADFNRRESECRGAILCCRRIFVPSEFVRGQYRANGYPAERIEVMPLGINLDPGQEHDPKKSRETAEVRLGYIGSLIPEKGIDLLVRAFRSVQNPLFRLDIYGASDSSPSGYYAKLRGLAASDPRIRFMGSFNPTERSTIYKNIDLLVLPSRFPETYSLVSREALAHGKPVLAARLGALPEAVRDGQNGFLFEPDDQQGLTRLIQQIASDPAILADLDCPGATPITGISEHALALSQVYRDVLASA